MKSKTLVFLLLIAFSSCNKDAPITEITLLTFKQDASSSTAFSDDWIFVTSESGELLDIKHFEADASIVLKSDKVTTSDKINVTIFHYLQPNTETIDFTSYLGISPNQTWVYNKNIGFSPTKTGTATFNVTNIVAPGSIGIYASTNVGQSTTRISSPTSIACSLYKPAERLFFCHNYDASGGPIYYETSNVKDGDIITANYNTDFKPLQNIFNLDLTGTDSFNGSVSGINNETGIDPSLIQGYLQYSIISFLPGGLRPWGYNSGFDLYRIRMSKGTAGTYFQYFKLGAPVTAIPFPTLSFTPTNKNLNGFAFSLSGDYQLRNSRWTVTVPAYNSVLYWRVYSPVGGKQIFTKIPDEIKNLYPALSFESLVMKDNTFINYLDGFTYSDFINGQMNIISSKKPYSSEYQTLIVQN